MEPILRATNLGKRFELSPGPSPTSLREALAGFGRCRSPGIELWALRDVSFDITPGEVVGVLGLNGAGKSTLLKIVCRIMRPTSGRVELYGRIATILEVGTGFHPDLTGRANVYLNGSLLGMTRSEIDGAFDAIVAFAELEQFVDVPVRHYSSGMYLRLAFAVAVHLKPEILVIDEVLAVGDVGFQRRCLAKMAEVASDGRTILLVSHDLASVARLCDRALLLERGRLAADGRAPAVVEALLGQIAPAPPDQTTADLRTWPRGGRDSPVFVEGWLNERPLCGRHAVLPERPLAFALVVESPDRMRDCSIAIEIENELGTRVLSLHTRSQLGRFDLGSGPSVVRCTLPSLPLVPGTYRICLGLTAEDADVDGLDGVAELHVAGGDVYGTGEPPDQEHGWFLTRPEWTVVAPNQHASRGVA